MHIHVDKIFVFGSANTIFRITNLLTTPAIHTYVRCRTVPHTNCSCISPSFKVWPVAISSLNSARFNFESARTPSIAPFKSHKQNKFSPSYIKAMWMLHFRQVYRMFRKNLWRIVFQFICICQFGINRKRMPWAFYPPNSFLAKTLISNPIQLKWTSVLDVEVSCFAA